MWLEATPWTAQIRNLLTSDLIWVVGGGGAVHEFPGGLAKHHFEKAHKTSETASQIIHMYKCIFLRVNKPSSESQRGLSHHKCENLF